jgi:hypothetical protein
MGLNFYGNFSDRSMVDKNGNRIPFYAEWTGVRLAFQGVFATVLLLCYAIQNVYSRMFGLLLQSEQRIARLEAELHRRGPENASPEPPASGGP